MAELSRQNAMIHEEAEKVSLVKDTSMCVYMCTCRSVVKVPLYVRRYPVFTMVYARIVFLHMTVLLTHAHFTCTCIWYSRRHGY